MQHLLCGLVVSLYVAVLRVSATPARWLPRQYQDPLTTSKTSPQECLETSLTNPKWGIFDPALITVNGSNGGSHGDIRFLTVNSATGLVANCTANNIELDPKGPDALSMWHNCSVPNLFFQFNLTSMDMRLKGTWSCDNSSRLAFAANGTWETPLIQGCLDDWNAPRGEETLCIMGNSQVSMGLSSPVTIQPQLPLLPYTPADMPYRCVDRSSDPEWTVESLLYRHHFAQMHNDTKTSHELALNLSNLSNNERVACSLTVDELAKSRSTDGSWPWIKCVPSHPPVNSNVSSTEVMLDTSYNVLGVRQTWNCSDGVPGVELETYSGTGFLGTGLQCGSPVNLAVTDKGGNVVGATSDYNCSLPATNLSGYADSMVPAMPHTYYTRSCTINSFNASSLSLREYQIDTSGTKKLGTFTLYNPGSGDTYRLYRMPVQDDGAWHQCIAGTEEPLPWQLVACQYQLGRKTGRIGFKMQWYCDDRDPNHAILFNVTVAKQLPAEKCDAPAAGNNTQQHAGEGSCHLPVNVTEVALPVSALTWTTQAGPMNRGPILPWI
ncbi:hypothetical protein QBC46DRAFT_265931 [Diplogelasinospora grovesii]|uniref:AA1-like domain-containing protein n=1 Tax=Diplogelasinospora grovesii TaxID=303347 RepID=A0AAN6S2J6_9PEZI|nr:hypothetical protein QBC46DRAFT_265931 [Diplogelasinospora grovesii]